MDFERSALSNNNMGTFIIRRLLMFIPTVIAITLIMFILLNVMPGDPAFLNGNTRRAADVEAMKVMRKKWGLDQPLYLRYIKFLGNLGKGDLGISFRTNRNVTGMLRERIPASLRLMVVAMLIAVIGGVVFGFISAVKQGSLFDTASMAVAVTGVSIPNFWLGLMLMYLFGVLLDILPTTGYGNGDIAHLILPSVTLGAAYMALIARISRATVLDVLHEDYVRTARSKGLSEIVVRVKHIFRNALIPVITIIGLQFGGMLASTVVVEVVFAWPGIGSLLVISIFRRDEPVIQGCILLIVFLFMLINLIIDILYAYIDPRIHYGG